MGLFDKIKKAIDNSNVIDAAKKALDDSGVLDAAKTAVKSFKDNVSTTKTQEDSALVEEPEEQPEPEVEEPEEQPEPVCEHGECVLCKSGYEYSDDEYLYFTCDKMIECDKKNKNALGELWDENLMPVIKAYAEFKKGDTFYAPTGVARVVINTYVPELYDEDFVCEVAKKISWDGVEEDSRLLVYFANLRKHNFEFLPELKEEYITMSRRVINTERKFDVASAEWLYKPSLYENSDPNYAFNLFATLSDEEWLSSHLLDTSMIDLNKFYHEDGTIKDAGTKTHDKENDTLWAIAERWFAGNENQETFAKEEEQERRMKICKSCRRYYDCNVQGLQENCAAFLPK